MESGVWRWTERVFAVRLKGNASVAATLRFRFNLPDAIMRATGPVRLHATVDGVRLPECEYVSPGEHTYIQPIPPTASTAGSRSIRFELDKALKPTGGDQRELGVQVVFWSCDSYSRALSPISIG